MNLYLLGQATDCLSQVLEPERGGKKWFKKHKQGTTNFTRVSTLLLVAISYLCNFCKAGVIDRSAFGNCHCAPAIVLRRSTTALRVRTTTSARSSTTHPAPWASAILLFGDESLLHFHLLPVLLQFSLFVDLVYGLGALVSTPWYPVVLRWTRKMCFYLDIYCAG